jgi:hypothetical protein
MNVLVCGDSHSSIFKYCNSVQNTYNFIGPGCAGASARGVLNPSSISDSYNVFNERLKNNKAEKVLVMLGEVDCSYLAWVSSYKYNTSVQEEIRKSITNLFEFIKTEVLEKYGYQNPQVIVVGSILAAIGDDVDKRRLHSLRPNVKATQREVTCLILAYNCELKRLCLQAGYTYFDITHRTMGDNGTINPYYVRENKYDHHLEPDKIRDLYMDELTKALQH